MFINETERLIALEEIDRALCSKSLISFTERFNPKYETEWVHREVAAKLERFIVDIEKKRSPRLIITMPPRQGKSTLSTIGLPPFLFAKHPDWDVITGCYSQELSNDFGEAVGGIMQTADYRLMAPQSLIGSRIKLKGSKDVAKNRFNLVGGGRYRCVGVGAGATGRGAHAFIIDDPYKGPEEADSEAYTKKVMRWYYGVALTRLAPGGGILIVMTRWGENDLVGQLLEAGRNDPEADQWDVIEYPALAVHDEPHRKKDEPITLRYGKEKFHKIRSSMIAAGQARIWNALYQCNPVPDQGVFFKKEWFRTYDKLPKGLTYYGTTDFAIGKKRLNDWSVFWVFGVDHEGNLYFTPRMSRERGSPGPKQIRDLKALLREYDAKECAYDFTQIGKTFEGFLRDAMNRQEYTDEQGTKQIDAAHYFSLWKFNPSQDKAVHAAPLKALMENGKVFFPAGVLFDTIVLPEFLAFLGGGKHDDIVDACAWATIMYNHLIRLSMSRKPKTLASDPVKRLKIIKDLKIKDYDDTSDRYRPLFGR